MLHVIVVMRIREGRMQDFLAACEELRPLVLAEAGCHGYEYTRDAVSPFNPEQPLEADRITLLERWESLEALKAHLETPHMKAAGAKMKGMRASVDLRLTESIFQ
jgi:quinol monooxygenase YgiN